MFKFISKNLLTGLITTWPVLLTIYLFYWFAISTEAVLGEMIRLILPEEKYRPGMGLMVGFVVLFMIGLLMHLYIVRWLFSKAEQVLFHMPVVKSVYRAFRDFLDYFSPSSKKEFQQVVSVTVGDTGMEVIGFITQADLDKMPLEFRKEDTILVYIPLSYMIGGYTVFMPRSAVRPIDMNMEEAMRFTLTAGVTGSASSADKKK